MFHKKISTFCIIIFLPSHGFQCGELLKFLNLTSLSIMHSFAMHIHFDPQKKYLISFPKFFFITKNDLIFLSSLLSKICLQVFIWNPATEIIKLQYYLISWIQLGLDMTMSNKCLSPFLGLFLLGNHIFAIGIMGGNGNFRRLTLGYIFRGLTCWFPYLS